MIYKEIKKQITLIFFLATIGFSGFAQTEQAAYFSFEEDSLRVLFDSIQHSKSDDVKFELNEIVLSFFEEILYNKISFSYPFDSLKQMGKIKSDDEYLRIYSWNLLLSDGTHKYYGFIQYLDKDDDEYFVYELIDKSDEIERPTRVSLTNEKWYGALYYKIIETKIKRRKYYTLLGWDGNNELTSKKIIDVLYFTSSNKPRFGTSILYNVVGTGRKARRYKQKRIIFEFSSRVSMSLHYDEKLKMIVFDHLSPSENHLKGKFEYYGPDWSYDALKFEKGKWQYYIDVDPRNPKSLIQKGTWKYNKSEDVF